MSRLKQLSQKWRKEADGPGIDDHVAATLVDCADELDAALTPEDREQPQFVVIWRCLNDVVVGVFDDKASAETYRTWWKSQIDAMMKQVWLRGNECVDIVEARFNPEPELSKSD